MDYIYDYISEERKKEIAYMNIVDTYNRTGLDQESSIRELARLLGGAQITDAVLENAREMKKLAGECKAGL